MPRLPAKQLMGRIRKLSTKVLHDMAMGRTSVMLSPRARRMILEEGRRRKRQVNREALRVSNEIDTATPGHDK